MNTVAGTGAGTGWGKRASGGGKEERMVCVVYSSSANEVANQPPTPNWQDCLGWCENRQYHDGSGQDEHTPNKSLRSRFQDRLRNYGPCASSVAPLGKRTREISLITLSESMYSGYHLI